MLITVAGLVLVLIAAFFVTWPLFAGAEPAALPAASKDSGESTPEKDKEQALLAIREADFDHRTGKLSDEDYGALRAELENRALSAMAAQDAASALHSVLPASQPAATVAAQPQKGGEPGGFCPACGVRFARGARFCPGCGKKLPAAAARGRRRA